VRNGCVLVSYSQIRADEQRHISACLPPLYRPPNDPPDLRRILSDALEAIHKPDAPASLLDMHVSYGELRDLRNISASAASATAGPPKLAWTMPTKKAPRSSFMLMDSVLPPSARGDDWAGDVSKRVDAVTAGGPSEPAKVEFNFEQDQHFAPSSPMSCSQPLTQPLGESSLAGLYLRPSTPSPQQLHSTPPLTLSQMYGPEGRDSVSEPTSPAPLPPVGGAVRESTPPMSPSHSAHFNQSTPPLRPSQLHRPEPVYPQDVTSVLSGSVSPPDMASADQTLTHPRSPGSASLSPSLSPEHDYPLPPPSQKRTGRFVLDALSPASQRVLDQIQPFRTRGSPRAKGDFPGKRVAALADLAGRSLCDAKRARMAAVVGSWD
jgi:hypothetical protein